MIKVKHFELLKMHEVSSGNWIIYAIVYGCRESRYFQGYTKNSAIKRFKELTKYRNLDKIDHYSER